ncbi:class I SAM-dependent methyltransferase [Actinotalea sp. M2MS4P-6]|uniref:class I SAM-dependent methyltransferase n=1 Tax=Actinotalea sp. M2MS4P-6 TaxID=2983762 RepID=UPI0021E46232|nr:class I SAM-dependent methyltransferase [Actinotalea sp. M2MS4P-6]MCV2393656.1 class I SAM-dependent methyltransferase [Actinotalea sp. M2MS4P-6]
MSTKDFYDGLADTYHTLYPDWSAETATQAAALERVIGATGPLDLADVACGIGTQLVGLARRGHRVLGSDLSEAAVRRARRECAVAGVRAALAVADMRALPWVDRGVDAVVCADNALPHLLTDEDAVAALAEMARVTRPGGAVVVTTRDYDKVLAERPRSTPAQVYDRGDGPRVVTVQLWAWRGDSDVYDLEHLQLTEVSPTDWTGTRREATYRAYRRDHLGALARVAGLDDVRWWEPAESGYFQPVMVARTPA